MVAGSHLQAGLYAVARPTHAHGFLLVGFWNNEVLRGDQHLPVGRLGLTGVNFTLTQEMVEWGDQVFAKVEVVVVHSTGHDKRARATTVFVKSF